MLTHSNSPPAPGCSSDPPSVLFGVNGTKQGSVGCMGRYTAASIEEGGEGLGGICVFTWMLGETNGTEYKSGY